MKLSKDQVTRLQPIRGRILVGVNLNQKSDFEYKTKGGLHLWGNRNFGFDGKQTQPVLAEVMSNANAGTHGLAAGDFVVCHHNTFNRNDGHGGLYGDTGQTFEGNSLFCVDAHNIQCKIDPETGEPLPLANFVLVRRIPIEYKTRLIQVLETKEYVKNQFQVTKVGGGTGDFDDIKLRSGDIVITYAKSDYSIEYTYDLKQFETVRVKYSDILAITDIAHMPYSR